MLQVIAAEIEFAQSGQRPPACEEEQVILTEPSVLEVDVDQSLAQSVEHDAQTAAYVTVAEIEPP